MDLSDVREVMIGATAVCQWHTQTCGTVFPLVYPSSHGTELVTNAKYGFILSITARVSNQQPIHWGEQLICPLW